MGKVKSKLERKAEIQEQYQAWKNFGFAGYVNDTREKFAKETIIAVAKNYDFIPSYFAAVTLMEGLGSAYLANDGNFTNTSPSRVRNDIPVNGFDVIGTDDFGSEFSRYKKYLPDNYNEGTNALDFKTGAEFYAESATNELGHETLTAVFKNIETAIWACGATLAHRRDTFNRHRKALGIPTATEDQLAYWTYFYYNGGEGKGYRALKAAKRLNIFDRNQCYPNCNVTAGNRTTNDVVLSVLASWRYLQEFKIFAE